EEQGPGVQIDAGVESGVGGGLIVAHGGLRKGGGWRRWGLPPSSHVRAFMSIQTPHLTAEQATPGTADERPRPRQAPVRPLPRPTPEAGRPGLLPVPGLRRGGYVLDRRPHPLAAVPAPRQPPRRLRPAGGRDAGPGHPARVRGGPLLL